MLYLPCYTHTGFGGQGISNNLKNHRAASKMPSACLPSPKSGECLFIHPWLFVCGLEQKITCSLNAGDRFHCYKPSVPPLPCAVLLCSWLWIPVCDNWVNYWGPDSARTPARYLRVTERHQRWNTQHNQVTREERFLALLTTRSVWQHVDLQPCEFFMHFPFRTTSYQDLQPASRSLLL